jgi:hypothetical protein
MNVARRSGRERPSTPRARSRRTWRWPAATVACAAAALAVPAARAADHNDPNAVNSIFSDVEVSAADLYDFFGFPSDDQAGGEKVVLALTFAPIPKAGTLDSDLLYRIQVAPTPRDDTRTKQDGATLEAMLAYLKVVEKSYVALKPAEVRVTVDAASKPTLRFIGFPGGDFQATIDANQVATVSSPGGHAVKVFVGGRDDAFFNDLPGFFRSINYAPQFYHVPQAMTDARELPIPKTLLELEGNKLFNFDPANPRHGQGVKLDLPPGPLTWTGDRFHKDDKGNFRFVYSGKDAQAGRNVNAIVLELPLAFITQAPATDRIVNAWGESWVLKASAKVPLIADNRAPIKRPLLLQRPWAVPGAIAIIGVFLLLSGLSAAARRTRAGGLGLRPAARVVAGLLLAGGGLALGVVVSRIAGQEPDLALSPDQLDDQLRQYKLIDTDGQAFADAALNLRENDRQLGAFNFSLATHFVTRLAHLGWGFGPSISALGLRTSFDHDNAPVSVHKEYKLAIEAFPRVKKVIFQPLNMPDDRWNKHKLPIPLRRPIDIFIPNVCMIDMDTTGTWPYGRRLEDQVATRFLSLFLDMAPDASGKSYTIETLADQALWDGAPIEPKTPPNPLKNDKEFLDHFPYLAAPW